MNGGAATQNRYRDVDAIPVAVQRPTMNSLRSKHPTRAIFHDGLAGSRTDRCWIFSEEVAGIFLAALSCLTLIRVKAADVRCAV
jgi:hypothetical protein